MKKVFFLSSTLFLLTLWSCQNDNISSDSKSIVNEQSLNTKNARICLEKFPPSMNGQVNKGSVLEQNRWLSGQTVRVKFLNGNGFLHQKVVQFASEWMNYANINFIFVASYENADIKINFDNSNASWSYYGNYSQNIPQNQASMNFGWFDSNTPDYEFSRTIIHEFGHALGMVHEHQNPNATIPWNRPVVYAYFGGAPNYWSTAQVDNNILNTFSPNQTNSGIYDRESIMHYFFPNGLTTDGSTFLQNNVLSTTDKSFIGAIYPFPQVSTRSVLNANESLYANEYITSQNGVYKCVLQSDGNLVVYQNNTTPLWTSNTNGTGADRLIMQGDGNLVVYNANYIAFWNTGTQSAGAYLIMQDDGNLVIYNNGTAIWSWMTGSL